MISSQTAPSKNRPPIAEAGRKKQQVAERLLRLSEVLHRIGCGRSTLYKMISDGLFDPPVILSVRSVGWTESGVSAYIERRVQERDERLAKARQRKAA